MITYTDSLDSITPDHLRGGFFAEWSLPLTPELHLRMLRGSAKVVLALDSESGQVVGYVNLITDGMLSAFIPNLEVIRPYQGQGIGTELMQRILAAVPNVPNIDLMCDPGVVPFYERLGMRPLGGMAIRKRNVNFDA